MVSSSYQWLCDGHEAIEIALQWSFKAYIDQFEAIAMPLTNVIARPMIEMPREALLLLGKEVVTKILITIFSPKSFLPFPQHQQQQGCKLES